MVAAHRAPRFTEKEYLALEAVAEIKHEYSGGDITGMAGAEPEHNQIAQNVRVRLELALGGPPCRVTGSDQRIWVEATGEYYYPDAVSTCLDARYRDPSPRSLVNPEVIIEVLSPTTESRDRGAKWLAYQTIPTLTDYVMIATEGRRVEHFERQRDGAWRFSVTTQGAFTLSSGVRLELDALYALSGV